MSYLGHDVLELNYNRIGAFEERLRRKFVLLSSKTGRRIADEQAPAPAASRPFTWTAIGRDEITAMRNFIDARKGRAVPFWLPSFQWDLALAEDISQNQSGATIGGSGTSSRCGVRPAPDATWHSGRSAAASWTTAGSPTPPIRRTT